MARRGDIRVSGKLIKDAREAIFLSQMEMATRAKIGLSSLQRIERLNETGMLRSSVPAMAGALGISEQEFVQRFVVKSNSVPDGIDARPMVVPPTFDIDVNATRWVQVPIAELNPDDPNTRAVLEDGRFELRINGDCMEPVYPSGSIVRCRLMDSGVEAMPVGKAYMFCRDDGTATFKALVKLHGEGEDCEYELAAINQSKYPGSFRVNCREIVRTAKSVGLVNPVPEFELTMMSDARPKQKAMRGKKR